MWHGKVLSWRQIPDFFASSCFISYVTSLISSFLSLIFLVPELLQTLCIVDFTGNLKTERFWLFPDMVRLANRKSKSEISVLSKRLLTIGKYYNSNITVTDCFWKTKRSDSSFTIPYQPNNSPKTISWDQKKVLKWE